MNDLIDLGAHPLLNFVGFVLGCGTCGGVLLARDGTPVDRALYGLFVAMCVVVATVCGNVP